jgi:hypothetical protein
MEACRQYTAAQVTTLLSARGHVNLDYYSRAAG